MSIADNTILQAIAALSTVDNVQMDLKALTDDAVFLTLAFSERTEYEAAVANTMKALKDLARGTVSTSMLGGAFQGWESYHYQPKVGQNVKADMRILFRREPSFVRVLAFGHRYIPDDLYQRVSSSRSSTKN